MQKKRLFWQLYLTYILITFSALFAIGWYMIGSVRELYFSRATEDLEARVNLVKSQIVKALTSGKPDELSVLCRDVGKNSAVRVTIVRLSGEVACDSQHDPATMDNHLSRQEIRQALERKIGVSTRRSNTLNQDMLYLATRLEEDGKNLGIARFSIPVASIEYSLKTIKLQIMAAGLVVAIIAAIVCLFISRRLASPLEKIKKAAERFAAGNLEHNIPASDSLEIGGLSQSLNQMAAQLHEKIQTITTQNLEKEAVLSSMTEGVLAVDSHERIISINKAAALLLEAPQDSQGRYIQETIRNVGLQELISKILSSRQTLDDHIILRFEDKRYLQVRGTILRDAQDQAIGALIVLNDVTRLRVLENTRRDFVANVSHELKTPITAIKGFVETLLGGAMQDSANARRFLDIIARQTERLNAIIEDLLSLSRIEQENEKSQISLEETALKTILRNAAQNCQRQAMERGVEIDLLCDDALRARVNPTLLEQAVVNLVDNAIKYSESGRTVQLSASPSKSGIEIQVRDWGCGIAQEHLPRLFERFYRVDKARSRKLGGTGLGLAIVKHIAQAHGGSVSVSSKLQEGSAFSIHIRA